MLSFIEHKASLILAYEAERQSVSWLDLKLSNDGEHTFSRTFTVTEMDRVDIDVDDPYNEEVRYFSIGKVDGEYWRIDRRVLNLQHDLLVSKSIALRKDIFIGYKNISIFNKIDSLVEEQIVVGGDKPGAIPEIEFMRLLKEFPTSTELQRYADSRVAQILAEYFDTMTDAEQKLVEYFKHRRGKPTNGRRDEREATKVTDELDLEKYTFVAEQLRTMLAKQDAYDELTWQRRVADIFLLIYPQYIAVLEDVSVDEKYSSPLKTTRRKFDLTLVNANGCLDLVEIKKPKNLGVLSQRTYRDNYVPLKELSGAIMQAEKYIFYLNKAGIDIEKKITRKYSKDLPKGFQIKVTNPKSIILCGRDSDFTSRQRDDFEFIRRKYSNVIDIVTYDDLLRRLDNIIESLKINLKVGVGSDK